MADHQKNTGRYHSAVSDHRKILEQGAAEIKRDILLNAYQLLLNSSVGPGLGMDPSKAQDLLAEFRIVAERISEMACSVATQHFLCPSYLVSLVKVSKSHKGTVKSNSRTSNNGPEAPWTKELHRLLGNKQFMNKGPSNDEIIERLIGDNAIEHEDRDGRYIDKETGRQIAKDHIAMRNSISKKKGQYAKSRFQS